MTYFIRLIIFFIGCFSNNLSFLNFIIVDLNQSIQEYIYEYIYKNTCYKIYEKVFHVMMTPVHEYLIN